MKKTIFFLTVISLIFSSEALAAKRRKNPAPKVVALPADILIEFEITQSDCQKFVASECFRRDGMRDEPYFHPTKLVILQNRIHAEQLIERDQRPRDKVFIPVRNGNFKVKRRNGNEISFTVKDAAVSDLRLLKGDLVLEKKVESRCDVVAATYGFYKANGTSGIIERKRLFKDEYNFDGLKEFIFFVEKTNQAEVMALAKNSNQAALPLRDIRLCQMPDEENFFVKHITEAECATNRDDIAAECTRYSACVDFLVVKDCNVVLLRDPMT